MADRRIFEWLGLDGKGVPYWLHALNLVWSDKGADHDLLVYRRTADLLATDIPYWAALIRDPSWRECLAACTCLLASGRKDFFDDLCFRFREGSWVAPQIAVALGLLHGASAKTFLETLLANPGFRKRPKQAISAHHVLLRLGVQPMDDIATESWNTLEQDDAIVAADTVNEQWDFWSTKIGPL